MTTTDKNTSETDSEKKSSPRKPIWHHIIKLVVVVAIVIVLFKTLPVADWLRTATDWIDSLGIWGPIAFISIYMLAALLFVPGSVLTAASGTMFGPVFGSIYVSLASTLSAAVAFLIGRHIARKKIEKRIKGNERFAAIDSAVAKEGWKIVGLTRLSPIFPFALLNYGYGITKVKFGQYLVASWIGMMPGTILYVYLGSLGKAASEGKTPLQWTMYGVGLLATVLVSIYVAKIAKRALSEKIPEESS